ncbi:PilX N-terminal domain-containing pilus assembly protein [Halomonas sp. 1390]|uniref:pilus assembly PilX family protein n=1 Tax=Halomonas sp. B23F22_3 TaxID=3459516 RepID=UPI00373EA968
MTMMMPNAGRQDGMALMIVLTLMAMGSMIGVSMFQSALLDERIAGNQRLGTLARMAAENAALDWLDASPPNTIPADDVTWEYDGEISSLPASYRLGYAKEVHLKERYSLEALGKGTYMVAVGYAGAGENPISRTVLVRVEAPLGLPPLEAVFTCFGGDCTASTGNHIDGEDHPLPEVFQCKGNGGRKGCKTTAPAGAPSIDEMRLYNDEWLSSESDKADQDEAQVLGEYADKREPWELLLASLPRPDSGNTYDSNTKKQEMGMASRDERGVIYVDGNVKFNGGTATSGILVVRDGAVLSVNGTAHHEGIILVEEGGRVDLANGTYDLYGGMVMLKPKAPSLGDEKPAESDAGRSSDLVLGGNIRFAYSSEAWESLESIQGGDTLGGGVINWREVP